MTSQICGEATKWWRLQVAAFDAAARRCGMTGEMKSIGHAPVEHEHIYKAPQDNDYGNGQTVASIAHEGTTYRTHTP